jgi:phosphoribosylamine--glycine ligase
MHTGKGIKVLENNSRPGDPEIMNLLPIIKDDFVDVCFKMIEGNLNGIQLEKTATVLTYKVPADYGGYSEVYPNKVDKTKTDTPVDLTQAYALQSKYGDKIRIYPGSMELREGKTYALKSRAIGVLGVGESIEEARQISLEGIAAISINGNAESCGGNFGAELISQHKSTLTEVLRTWRS